MAALAHLCTTCGSTCLGAGSAADSLLHVSSPLFTSSVLASCTTLDDYSQLLHRLIMVQERFASLKECVSGLISQWLFTGSEVKATESAGDTLNNTCSAISIPTLPEKIESCANSSMGGPAENFEFRVKEEAIDEKCEVSSNNSDDPDRSSPCTSTQASATMIPSFNMLASGCAVEEQRGTVTGVSRSLGALARPLGPLLASTGLSEPVAARKSRFKEVSEEDIRSKVDKSIPESTRKKQKWAFHLYLDWCKEKRNYSEDQVIRQSDEALAESLIRFVMEVKKENGEEYPGPTIYQIMTCIQGYLRSSGRMVRLLDEKSETFARLRSVVDATMEERAADGTDVRSSRGEARPVSTEVEDTFWREGVFSVDSGQGLLQAVFFYVGMRMGIRRGKELYALSRRNLKVEVRDGRKWLVYTKDTSKAYKGGIKNKKSLPKKMEVTEEPDLNDRCVVKLYEMYSARCPPTQHFFCHPIVNPVGSKWFSIHRVGVNKCREMMKKQVLRG